MDLTSVVSVGLGNTYYDLTSIDRGLFYGPKDGLSWTVFPAHWKRDVCVGRWNVV